MSLDWNATAVKNPDEVLGDDLEGNKTAYLCFAMLATGVGSITEANYIEVATRIRWFEKLRGNLFTDSPYTVQDIQRRIGYTCNVKDEAWSSVVKRLFGNDVSDAEYLVKKLEVAEAIG